MESRLSQPSVITFSCHSKSVQSTAILIYVLDVVEMDTSPTIASTPSCAKSSHAHIQDSVSHVSSRSILAGSRSVVPLGTGILSDIEEARAEADRWDKTREDDGISSR
jgi:hypothetical protein